MPKLCADLHGRYGVDQGGSGPRIRAITWFTPSLVANGPMLLGTATEAIPMTGLTEAISMHNRGCGYTKRTMKEMLMQEYWSAIRR